LIERISMAVDARQFLERGEMVGCQAQNLKTLLLRFTHRPGAGLGDLAEPALDRKLPPRSEADEHSGTAIGDHRTRTLAQPPVVSQPPQQDMRIEKQLHGLESCFSSNSSRSDCGSIGS